MSTLRSSLFGKFCARRNEQIEDGFDVNKKLELLCYSPLLRQLYIILQPEILTVQSKKNSLYAHLQLQTERHTLLLDELNLSPSKPSFQFVKEIIFSAFLTPNGEWNESIP
jgi:hypothetical protein